MDETVILSLLIEDLESLEEGWKGKAAEGSALADDQIAVELQKTELQKREKLMADVRMARSISRAVQDDGTTVAILAGEERRAAQDREMACRMSGQPDHHVSNLPDCRVDEDILSKFGALNLRTDYEDDFDGFSCYESVTSLDEQEAGESSSWAVGHIGEFKGKGKPKKECIACSEIRDTVQAPCHHDYCKVCIVKLASDSTVDESLFPPRCCRQEIPMSLIRPFIDANLAAKFEQTAIEFGSPYRTYCHACGVFINPDSVQGHRAYCKTCNIDTCMLCKGPLHSGDCPKDRALEAVLNLAQAAGWQRCMNCQTMIERGEGCNHIT